MRAGFISIFSQSIKISDMHRAFDVVWILPARIKPIPSHGIRRKADWTVEQNDRPVCIALRLLWNRPTTNVVEDYY